MKNRFYRFLYLLKNSLIDFFSRKTFPANVFMELTENYQIKHKNWGDDINKELLYFISGKKVFYANYSLIYKVFTLKNYSCIGSILGMYENEKTEVWGSGVLSEEMSLRALPAKVHLVRGKLTRNYLINQGVPCPENYGDPALLISDYYQPKISRRYKMGIIPHYVDLGEEIIMKYISKNQDVVLIDVANYNKWTDICDLIASCDFIISSSLHGLIVSDSYGVPNLWVRFSDRVFGGDFKFLDYFSAVNRVETSPVLIKNASQLDEIKFRGVSEVVDVKSCKSVIYQTCPFLNTSRRQPKIL